MAIEHNDRDIGGDAGGIDWDAAFEALVAPLRPRRYVRIARATVQLIGAVVLLTLCCWILVQVMVEPMRELGRPWF